MFRLPSVGGLAIDELLKVCESEKKIGYGYFNQVSTPATKEGEYSISIINDKKTNNLAILPDQVVFKKTSNTYSSAINVEKAIDEFQLLWRAANKIIGFPEIRRIGLVGEYRLKERKPGDAGLQLIESLTKFNAPESCGRFHLTFEERNLKSNGGVADKDIDDFWNQINSFYISDIDETPEKGMINANIDVQKYFNPAKKDPMKDLGIVKERYLQRKKTFKEDLMAMGLSDK